jgi:hypothetical protein
VQEALTNLARDGKAPTPSGVIAALTFSFWTAVLGPAHETLWQTDLHRIGRREDGKGLQRKAFSGPLTPIRILRNRVAHHEPILAWNLPQHHAAMVRIIGWLSLSAAIWCDGLNRFAAVYPPQRLMLYQD